MTVTDYNVYAASYSSTASIKSLAMQKANDIVHSRLSLKCLLLFNS